MNGWARRPGNWVMISRRRSGWPRCMPWRAWLMTGPRTTRPASMYCAAICACHTSLTQAIRLPCPSGLPPGPAAKSATVIRVITAHLQKDKDAAMSWPGLDFDFSGGTVNFSDPWVWSFPPEFPWTHATPRHEAPQGGRSITGVGQPGLDTRPWRPVIVPQGYHGPGVPRRTGVPRRRSGLPEPSSPGISGRPAAARLTDPEPRLRVQRGEPRPSGVIHASRRGRDPGRGAWDRPG